MHCRDPKCRHQAVFSAGDYPDEVPVSSFQARMKCSTCGAKGRQIDVADRTHVTSPQPQYFLAKAAECLGRSLAVPDREYQRLYCELAAQWLILAHEADTKNNQKFCGCATANK